MTSCSTTVSEDAMAQERLTCDVWRLANETLRGLGLYKNSFQIDDL